jgi:DNA-binding NtrC family response regulator
MLEANDRSQQARILIVDDDPTIASMLQFLLRRSYQVDTLMSGADARRHLEEHSYDLIFCDLIMPDFSGMDLYLWLKDHRPELLSRIILMTGGAFTEVSRRFLRDPAIVTLEKPFNIMDVQEIIQQRLVKQPMVRA